MNDMNKRTQTLTLRLSPVDKTLLEELSSVCKTSQSEIIRMALYYYAQNIAFVSPIVTQAAKDRIEKVMSKIN